MAIEPIGGKGRGWVKTGEVLYIRVNPTDCLGCIDVVKAAGVVTTGMSFAQVTRIALSVLIKSARESGVIPERQGFEFTEMMLPFKDRSKGGITQKLKITKGYNQQGESYNPPALGTAGPDLSNPSVLRRFTRYQELKFKRDNSPENMSEEEMNEYRPLVDEFL